MRHYYKNKKYFWDLWGLKINLQKLKYVKN